MADPDEVAGLLREIRDLLAAREQQYADHLKKSEELYEQQVVRARVAQERAFNRRLIVGVVVAALLYAACKFG
jgi:hypothetical protein